VAERLPHQILLLKKIKNKNSTFFCISGIEKKNTDIGNSKGNMPETALFLPQIPSNVYKVLSNINFDLDTRLKKNSHKVLDVHTSCQNFVNI